MKRKSKYVQYYVEGECEEKLISVLKSDLGLIIPGKVQKMNPVESVITEMRLRTLSPKTMVVLVFDTDTGHRDILDRNISLLNANPNISEVVIIPQVLKLEDELTRACRLRRITDLLGSRSTKDFKSSFIHVTNLSDILTKSKFDIDLLWNQNPPKQYKGIENQSARIKIPQK